ncbi:MAG TPA: hypothetical protein VH080_04365, partial [Gemmatimonadaceae bacterium]|nr:hypothetical protein [Gemmatimonadaceae bacterium]
MLHRCTDTSRTGEDEPALSLGVEAAVAAGAELHVLRAGDRAHCVACWPTSDGARDDALAPPDRLFFLQPLGSLKIVGSTNVLDIV